MERLEVSQAAAAERGRAEDALPLEIRPRLEAPLVERFGGESADVRMEPVRVLEEQAQGVRDRLAAVEQMGERRTLGSGRVRALERLIELLRVAEQHDGARRAGDGQDIRQRHLARLVDEQHVDQVVAVARRPQPRRSADDVEGSTQQAVADDVVALRDHHVIEVDALAVLGDLLRDPDLDARLARGVVHGAGRSSR